MEVKEQGFTLIELLAVVLIIALLGTVATFSNRMLFDGNVRSYASQFATTVREVKQKTLVSNTSNMTLSIGKNSSDTYYWEVSGMSQKNEIPKNVEVLYDGTALGEGTKEIKFTPGTGQVETGEGTYTFRSRITGKEIQIQIIKNTGGVIIND